MSSNNEKQAAEDFVERVRANQQKLRSGLKSQYDFVVCGSGSSGSVIARRLAENPEVSVLLLEAGGSDDTPSVTEALRWFENLGTERDWNFVAQPNPHLKGRSIPLNMGKVLGGGSSINVMLWARGHKHDWDFFASESGDPAWNYESVLEIYRRMEDWRDPHPHRPTRRQQPRPPEPADRRPGSGEGRLVATAIPLAARGGRALSHGLRGRREWPVPRRPSDFAQPDRGFGPCLAAGPWSVRGRPRRQCSRPRRAGRGGSGGSGRRR